MPRKCVCVALVAIFALAASRSAQAQVTIDVICAKNLLVEATVVESAKGDGWRRLPQDEAKRLLGKLE